jgi:hypothetical protein
MECLDRKSKRASYSRLTTLSTPHPRFNNRPVREQDHEERSSQRSSIVSEKQTSQNGTGSVRIPAVPAFTGPQRSLPERIATGQMNQERAQAIFRRFILPQTFESINLAGQSAGKNDIKTPQSSSTRSFSMGAHFARLDVSGVDQANPTRRFIPNKEQYYHICLTLRCSSDCAKASSGFTSFAVSFLGRPT